MMTTSAQKTSERTPRTLTGVGRTPSEPWKHSRRAYSGLVPISPNTTPSAATMSQLEERVRASCAMDGIVVSPGASQVLAVADGRVKPPWRDRAGAGLTAESPPEV